MGYVTRGFDPNEKRPVDGLFNQPACLGDLSFYVLVTGPLEFFLGSKAAFWIDLAYLLLIVA